MWVFTKDGFFSAVQDRDDQDKVVIRSRFEDDLFNLLGKMGRFYYDILYTPEADYPVRIVASKDAWGEYLNNYAINDLDYPNFKASLTDDTRHDCYLKVWMVLRDEQLRIEKERQKPAPKTTYPIVKRKPKNKK